MTADRHLFPTEEPQIFPASAGDRPERAAQDRLAPGPDVARPYTETPARDPNHAAGAGAGDSLGELSPAPTSSLPAERAQDRKDSMTGADPRSDGEGSSLLQAIIQMASNPALDVAKFDALLQMQERMERRQAESQFNEALARLAGKMPRVKKNGTVSLGTGKGTYPFARWEDIDRIIRPMLDEEGFSLSFTSAPRQADGGGLIVTGTLLHRNGHSMSAAMPLPLDTGPGRNNLQATGSTLSYGKRYCAEMLLNIVREGDDDDGGKWTQELITDEQCAELSREMTGAGMSERVIFDLLGVTALGEIRKDQLAVARNAIGMRRRRATEKPT